MTASSKEVAQNFFAEMAAWEKWMESCGYDTNLDSQKLQKLKLIFEKYLSAKALQRHQSRYDLLSFGMPPEFEHAVLRVEEESSKKHWVYVPTGMMGGEAKYLLILENDSWKVDRKEDDIAANGKWKKWLDL
jgi:NTF2 fold immunity protein